MNRQERTNRQVVRVGLTQMRCGLDLQENLEKQLGQFEAAARDGAKVLCTPELFRTRYFCQSEEHANFSLAEPIPGPTTRAMGKLARKHKAVVIVSIFERRAAGVYHNSAAIIEQNGSIAGVYRKMHIPDDPLYYEKFYFAPGDTGFRCWNTSRGKLGVLVCWDQWYPEAARLAALAGAEILFYPSAIGWHPSEKARYGAAQSEAWDIMHRSHALANGCFVCASNRVGYETTKPPAGQSQAEGIDFWGGSIVVAPDGKVIKRGAIHKEQVVIADLDLAQVEFSRTHWPFLRDRRIDAYGDLLQRFAGENEAR